MLPGHQGVIRPVGRLYRKWVWAAHLQEYFWLRQPIEICFTSETHVECRPRSIHRYFIDSDWATKNLGSILRRGSHLCSRIVSLNCLWSYAWQAHLLLSRVSHVSQRSSLWPIQGCSETWVAVQATAAIHTCSGHRRWASTPQYCSDVSVLQSADLPLRLVEQILASSSKSSEAQLGRSAVSVEDAEQLFRSP